MVSPYKDTKYNTPIFIYLHIYFIYSIWIYGGGWDNWTDHVERFLWVGRPDVVFFVMMMMLWGG